MNKTVPPSRTILIVDDSAEIRELLEIALNGQGHSFIRCDGVEAAMKEWGQRKASVDVLITDVRLGQSSSGLDLAERLLTEQPSLKVLAISGFGTFKALTLAGRRVEFLQKPFGLADVASRVAALLAMSESRPN